MRRAAKCVAGLLLVTLAASLGACGKSGSSTAPPMPSAFAWQAPSGPPGRVMSLAARSSGDIFAGTRHAGVIRSVDFGAHWFPANTGIQDKDIYALITRGSGELYAGTEGGVWRSTDNGANWTAVSSGLTVMRVVTLASRPNGQVIAGTANGVFRSIDNGASWSAASSGLITTDVLSLAVTSAGNVLAGTNYGGVCRSQGE